MCVCCVFLGPRWPRGHQGTTPGRACISHTAQERAAHATPRQDRRRTAPIGNTSNGGRWVLACAHNINTDPTTDHTKKHALTSKASTRARAMTPLKAPGATPKQRGKTPTRPDANRTARARASDNHLHAQTTTHNQTNDARRARDHACGRSRVSANPNTRQPQNAQQKINEDTSASERRFRSHK